MRLESGCKVLLSLKSFLNGKVFYDCSFFSNFDGVSVGSINELYFSQKYLSGLPIYAFSPVFKEEDIYFYGENSKGIIFNSCGQYFKYYNSLKDKCDIGLRLKLNENYYLSGYSDFDYVNSQFGECIDDIDDKLRKSINGLLVHVMCEQFEDSLELLINNLKRKYLNYFPSLKWINLGGGQLICSENYDIEKAICLLRDFRRETDLDVYLEPSEGIYCNSGYFKSKIIDKKGNKLFLDSSVVSHTPFTLLGWDRDIIEGSEYGKYEYELYGCSCSARDKFGTYCFEEEKSIGDVLTFADSICYSVVLNNNFNGILSPYIYSKDIFGNISLL